MTHLLTGILLGAVVLGDGPANAPTTDKLATGDTRVLWTTSRVKGTPEPPPPYVVEPVFGSLKFLRPIELTNAPGTDRLFVAELDGKIFSFRPGPDVKSADVFADLRAALHPALRIYGLEFHPNFAKNRYVYVCYVLEDGRQDGTRVSRFTVSTTEPPVLDPKSELQYLTWLSGGHNGGCLKFGPDGYLYIATGDATPPSPPDALDTGQDTSDLLGAILRIDVDHPDPGRPYGIPKNNPLRSVQGARPEIYAYGFRNPWKMSFDRRTGDLWAGDVGWELWEMIYRIVPGGNYGWSVMEGRQVVRPEAKRGPTPILPPIVDHQHSEAASITGGFVYRGSPLPELVGTYVYGDYVTGKFWGFRFDGQQVTEHRELANSTLQIIAFGEDHAGELYVMDYERTGKLYRLVPNPAARVPVNFPRRLSQTGLLASVQDHRPAAGVIPYSINAEPWSDYAVAERLLAIPGSGRIEPADAQPWKFPEGTVLVKTLALETEFGNPASRRRIETQLLHFEDQSWRYYTYRWNADQTDAELVGREGAVAEFQVHDGTAPDGYRTHQWRFAGQGECAFCHNPWAGTVLGVNTLQLHRSADSRLGQLESWTSAGLFAKPFGQPLEKLPRLTDPANATADLMQRARSYLHANCAHCHRFGGGGTATIDLDFFAESAKTQTIGLRPTQGSFNISSPAIVAPGDPAGSILYYRMAKTGPGRMPRLGSQFVDVHGLRLIHDWIAQLPGGGNGNGSPVRSSVSIVKAAGNGDTAQTVHKALATTRGALGLIHSLDARELPEPARREILTTVRDVSDPEIRELFERFLPEKDRTRRATGGTVAEILARKADAARGRALFEGNALQCKTCHRIGAVGTALGPDLSQIGKKYPKPLLLYHIVEPSREIAPEYLAYLLETRAGELFTGLLVERTAQQVVLKDARGELIRVAVGDVALLVPQQKSLMPELLFRDLATQDAADLLEYLSSLR